MTVKLITMALYKIALFLAFACLVQSKPLHSVAVNDWQLVLTLSENISVSDGNNEPWVQVDITLNVYGDYNKTTDSNMVSEFVQEKLASLQYQPETTDIVGDGDTLPLLISAELKAIIDVAVPVQRSVALLLDVQVYARKKNHHLALELVNNLKTSFNQAF